MITNEKEFLKVIKKDFPEFKDNSAILEDAEEQLCIKEGDQVEFFIFRNNKKIIKLYDFKLLKNGKRRFLK